VRTKACHQSVVLADAGIKQFYGGELWVSVGPLHPFAVTLPPYHSVTMAQHLGLGAGPTYHPLVAVRATIDFALPFGQELWLAP